MEIRFLSPDDDRRAVSRIYERSWKFAYKDIIPQAYLDSIPEGRWAESLDAPGRSTLLCVENGKPVGTSSFCAARLQRLDGWGEIVSLYLLPEYMGRGWGAALIGAALTELRRQGCERVYLWVLEENNRARGFYEKAGFTQTGDCLNDSIGGRELRELRYELSLKVGG